MEYTMENLQARKDIGPNYIKLVPPITTEPEEYNTQPYSLLVCLPSQPSYESIERPGIQPFTSPRQHLLGYWRGYIAIKPPALEQFFAIVIKDYFENLKEYAREEDIEFLEEVGSRIKCFVPILIEIIREIERKYNAKVEISVIKDNEIGNRVYIIVSDLQFNNLEEKYELEDELEIMVWRIIKDNEERYSPQEIEEANMLISILVP